MKKRAKVHMLPTNGKDIAMLSKRVKDSMLQSANGTEGVANCNTMWQPQHLYFTRGWGGECKHGDWFFCTNGNKVYQYLPIDDTRDTSPDYNGTERIIATTDPKLKIECSGCRFHKNSGDVIYTCSCETLPQPSQATIKAYCDQGGFDECDVEYEQFYVKGNYTNTCVNCKTLFHNTDKLGFICKDCGFKLKVDPIHNTITTHRIVEKMYSKDDMKKMWIHLGEQGWGDSSGEGFDKWIKENL